MREGISELEQQQTGVRAALGVAAVTLMASFAMAVHGYHPYAEDGGVYIAGIRKLLDPSLYPAYTEFVTEHLRFSIFAPGVARLVRASHLRLEYVLMGLYFTCIWATLYAGLMLAQRVTADLRARLGAVALLACWLTLPVAGTSLMLFDPYVTARSLTTPLILMALAWALEACALREDAGLVRASLLRSGAALLVAGFLHPLMAGYGVAAVALLLFTGSTSARVRRYGPAGLALLTLSVAAFLQAKAPAESADYVRVALTRDYWFPFAWHWYEQVGLVAPLLLLWWGAQAGTRAWRLLARAALLLGLLGMLVAAVFAHPGFATHMVARMQPLRSFQVVYAVMILLLGAQMGQRLLKAEPLRWALALVALAGPMFWAERETFPHSAHLELPWQAPANSWVQAFQWARQHTPSDAVFALNPHYVMEGANEDAQCFRAVSERSALPDYSKDGGETAITPDLTAAWVEGQAAQEDLERESDAERQRKLEAVGASWMVLERGSATGFACPYRNDAVKVCRLPALRIANRQSPATDRPDEPGRSGTD